MHLVEAARGAEILVTVPQVQELEPLLDALRAAGVTSRTVVAGRLGGELFDALRMLFVVGGHGKAQHAVHTQHVIDNVPGLQVLMCAGAAGALDAGLVPGDVVVGACTIEHDYTLRFVQRPLPRWDADDELLAELRRAADRTGASFRTMFGAIASGDEDVVDRARALELAKATGALCVAWEGRGRRAPRALAGAGSSSFA